ncbi:MAG: Rieske (2Fe-2S) protein [Candidatus Dormibacteraeota bacterium]|nr:Rieske (2Fe-2S) protein [Candidatus Dormibacteraeota bacterium]
MKAASEMLTGGRVGAALNRLIEAVERQESLDAISAPVASVVQAATKSATVKNLLSGPWLGHQLHPVLTDLPIGFWTSALVLDVAGGQDSEKAADMMVAMGNLSALGAAASGLADWSDLYGGPQRSGLVHAATNAVALTLFGLSSAARMAGSRRAGRALAMAGWGTVSAAAYIGGHLVYRRGSGVTHAGFEIDEELSDWHHAGAAADLTDGQPKKVNVDGADILLFKQGGSILALASTCGHAGGPLHEGEFADGAVTCPWHGSRFALVDGCVLRGPASMPQPAFETRVHEGKVEVRAKTGQQ